MTQAQLSVAKFTELCLSIDHDLGLKFYEKNNEIKIDLICHGEKLTLHPKQLENLIRNADMVQTAVYLTHGGAIIQAERTEPMIQGNSEQLTIDEDLMTLDVDSKPKKRKYTKKADSKH